MAPRFIHLHNHSEYSVLDGAIRVARLPEAAAEHGMGAVALTDHGNLFGAVAFAKAAKKVGVKPIFGSEVYVAPHSRFDREVRDQETAHYHLLLLVRDEVGYRNLCVLLSKAYLEGFYYRPRVDKELLAAHSQGLIALSACLKGEVAFLLGRDQDEAAAKAAGEYAEIFGREGFYIELMDHGLEPQQKVNPKLVRLARSLGLPLAASNDCHYRKQDDAESHDALLCIQTNKKISRHRPDQVRVAGVLFQERRGDGPALRRDPGGRGEHLLRSRPAATSPSPRTSISCPASSRPTAGPCGLTSRRWPGRASPGGWSRSGRGWRGPGRPTTEAEYKERFERELKLIEEMEFEGYFLIVWDLLRAARAKDIPVGPGRGSAAGSLLAYCLGITDIDPIEYDLLFERFLNPERISLPDIDMDFCARRREEMIRYVREKYGEENVSQIITFGTMAARAAIRDVGRVWKCPCPRWTRSPR